MQSTDFQNPESGRKDFQLAFRVARKGTAFELEFIVAAMPAPRKNRPFD